MAQPSSDSLDFRLDAHRWEHRVLVIFVPDGDEERLEEQEDRLAGSDEGFRDRDLLLLTVHESEGHVRKTPGAEPLFLTEAAVNRLYQRFDVPVDDFRVILVGKDGTEKRRAVSPVDTRSIFDTIDGMPMRQRELRERDDSNGES